MHGLSRYIDFILYYFFGFIRDVLYLILIFLCGVLYILLLDFGGGIFGFGLFIINVQLIVVIITIHYCWVGIAKRGCGVASMVIIITGVVNTIIFVVTWKKNVIVTVIRLVIVRQGLKILIEKQNSMEIVEVKGVGTVDDISRNGKEVPIIVDNLETHSKDHKPPSTLDVTGGTKGKVWQHQCCDQSQYTGFR